MGTSFESGPAIDRRGWGSRQSRGAEQQMMSTALTRLANSRSAGLGGQMMHLRGGRFSRRPVPFPALSLFRFAMLSNNHSADISPSAGSCWARGMTALSLNSLPYPETTSLPSFTAWSCKAGSGYGLDVTCLGLILSSSPKITSRKRAARTVEGDLEGLMFRRK